jgi:uncharacterized protein (DUF1778 family)
MVGRRKMKRKTEKDKADLVVRKIIKGAETTIEDQQVFINNAEYIEQRLQEIVKNKSR